MSHDTLSADVLERWNACGYYELMGMRVTRADGAGSVFTIEITPAHTQLYGTAHGGVLAGMLDAAMALAILAQIPYHEGCATIEMKVNFTAPGTLGVLIGTGEVITLGRRVAVARAEVRDPEDRLVAVAQGTFQRFPRG